MRTETVDEMLRNYREYAARCAYLECAIKEAKKLLMKVRASAVSDAISVTQHYSDMPGGKGGASDPTARIATRIADGYQSDRELALEAEIAGMEDELRDKTPTVVYVEAWLSVLNPEERFVIENQMIDGMIWRKVIFTYRKAFGDGYSKDTLKRIKNAALDKIYRVAA
jgi:hypothetical protein